MIGYYKNTRENARGRCFVDQIGVASELTDLFDDRIVIDINYIH